jgi:pimeloyl-ACP methyl ester carboxylesterase
MDGVGQDHVGDLIGDEPGGRVCAGPGERLPVVERFVDNGGVRLNVATAGSGRPVLLLHGFPDSWRLWRHGAEPNTDPDCDRQIADVARPGALTAGLNWYRANVGPAAVSRSDPGAPVTGQIRCPTMGVWSSGDQFLSESQMTGSEQFVSGGWRYERLTCDHWVPVHAADEFGQLLLDFGL